MDRLATVPVILHSDAMNKQIVIQKDDHFSHHPKNTEATPLTNWLIRSSWGVARVFLFDRDLQEEVYTRFEFGSYRAGRYRYPRALPSSSL